MSTSVCSQSTRRTAGSSCGRYAAAKRKGETKTGSRSRRRRWWRILARTPPPSSEYARKTAAGKRPSSATRSGRRIPSGTIKWKCTGASEAVCESVELTSASRPSGCSSSVEMATFSAAAGGVMPSWAPAMATASAARRAHSGGKRSRRTPAGKVASASAGPEI